MDAASSAVLLYVGLFIRKVDRGRGGRKQVKKEGAKKKEQYKETIRFKSE